MPNDPYQIGDTDSGITLVLSDRGVSVAAAHALSHVGSGADAIREATPSVNGLMSSAFAAKLTGISPSADVTATALPAAINALGNESTPVDGDALVMWDASATTAPKKLTLTNLREYLDDSFATLQSAQTLTSKALVNCTMSGGSLSGVSIPFADNTFVGALPVANGGTGATSATGTGFAVLQTSPQLVTPLLGTPTSGSLTNCTNLPIIAGTTGTLSVARGGTGATTLNGVVRGTGTAVLTAGPVALASEVSGTLPVTNGGTGAATLNGVVRGTGTSPLTAGPVVLTSEVSGVLPIANGGTGVSANPYGQISGQTPGALEAYNTTFEKLGIDTTLSALSVGFDTGASTTNNKLRYTGTSTRRFLIFASVDILDDAAGSNYSIKLYKNGTIALDETECRANTAGKGGSFLAKLVTNWIVELAQNDFVELFVASTTSDEGTPQRMRIVATPV